MSIPVKFMPFTEALYNFKCVECKENVCWEANFDADGTVYNTTCCGNHYRMETINVKISWDKDV